VRALYKPLVTVPAKVTLAERRTATNAVVSLSYEVIRFLLDNVSIALSGLSILIAVAFPIYLEYLKRPRIDIVPQPHGVGDEFGHRILHIQVYNRPYIRRPYRWIQVSPLYASRVNLSYFRAGQRLFDVTGIWSARPRPLLGGVYDPERASEAQVLDLFASDQPYSVPFAVKFRGEEVAYGFRAESYRYGNPGADPRLQLAANSEGEVHVRVVGGSPKQHEYRFIIRNFGPELQQFEIRQR